LIVTLEITAISLVLAGCLIDIKEQRLPNWCTVSLFALGIMLQYLHLGSKGIPDALLGAFAFTGIYFFMMKMFGMKLGGGDVKLIMAVGAFAGLHNFYMFLPVQMLTSAIMELVYIIYKKKLYTPMSFYMQIKNELLKIAEPVYKPQGPFIGVPFIVYIIVMKGWFCGCS